MMNAEELKYPDWQRPLKELILEFDDEKTRQKTDQVESLILARLQKLRQEGDDSELLALNDALRILQIVKRNRLGCPDWKRKDDLLRRSP